MIQDQLQQKINSKTKPLGSLGLLEKIALQIGTIQKTLSPEIRKPTVLVFAADHGLADESISSYPKEVTWQMMMNYVGGGAGVNVFCRQHGLNLNVIDAGVDYDFPPEAPIINAKIARGTRNALYEPAMTETECEAAIAKGKSLVQELHQQGCNAIGCGEMGIGNTSASALLMHKILDIPLDQCVGAGTGLNDEGLRHKLEVLQKVADRHQPQNAQEILQFMGGLEMAMMVGAFLEAYHCGMILMIDGFIATACLLVAWKMEPEILSHCIFCHQSNEKGHKQMLDSLGVQGILDIGLRLGEATGVAIAFPLIQSAVTFLNEMASFDEAGVSNRDDL